MKKQATQQVNKELKALSQKMVLLGVSLIILLGMLVYFSAAWYTKMVSVSGMKFEAAQWEFAANMSISDFNIRVYEYASLKTERASPGTGGWIPIELSAEESETDVKYTIMVDKTTMSKDFQKRIYFYYHEKNADGTDKLGADGKPIRVYLCGSPENPAAEALALEGKLTRGTKETVMLYWEWVYAPQGPYADSNNTLYEAPEKWDEFDTNVGKNPELYESDMVAKVTIAGVEVKPENGQMPAN